MGEPQGFELFPIPDALEFGQVHLAPIEAEVAKFRQTREALQSFIRQLSVGEFQRCKSFEFGNLLDSLISYLVRIDDESAKFPEPGDVLQTLIFHTGPPHIEVLKIREFADLLDVIETHVMAIVQMQEPEVLELGDMDNIGVICVSEI